MEFLDGIPGGVSDGIPGGVPGRSGQAGPEQHQRAARSGTRFYKYASRIRPSALVPDYESYAQGGESFRPSDLAPP